MEDVGVTYSKSTYSNNEWQNPSKRGKQSIHVETESTVVFSFLDSQTKDILWGQYLWYALA